IDEIRLDEPRRDAPPAAGEIWMAIREISIDGGHAQHALISDPVTRSDLASVAVLLGTLVRAAITGDLVPVVALFFTEEDSVSTERRVSGGGPRGPRGQFPLAVLVAPVEGHGVAVVASLGAFHQHASARRVRALT